VTPRVASKVLVGALIRRAEIEGGFAAVLARGDEISGAILVILTERGRNPRALERLLLPAGDYAWQSPTAGQAIDPAEVAGLIARRRRFDPDLWVIELDIPSGERFAAVMNALG
jgi:hypothetical protein